MTTTQGLSRVQVKTREQEKDDFRADFMRLCLHLQIAKAEVELFRENKLVRCNPFLKQLGRLAFDLDSRLKETSTKSGWFVRIAKTILGKLSANNIDLLNQELDPSGHKVANVAQLTEWVAMCPRDLSNEVDLIVNGSRRKELFLRAWKDAIGTNTLSDHDMIRFNSWYSTKFNTAS